MDDIASMNPVVWTVSPCDLGVLALAVTGDGVAHLTLHDDEDHAVAALANAFGDKALVRDDAALTPFVDGARSLIAGKPATTDVAVAATGTPFQHRVWDELRRIPRGETRTYGEVAAAIGSPRAMRAVGSACAANPVAVVVPCHRVVPASGGTGNYAGGAARKRELLRREGVTLPR